MSKRISREEQIRMMTAKHDGFYSYEKWGWPTAHQKSTITCPIHGDFKTTFHRHKNKGTGCPKCGKVKVSKHLSSLNDRQWQDPDYVERMSKKMSLQNSDPEFKAKASQRMKDQWKDPEFKAKALKASHNGPSKGEYLIRQTLESFGLVEGTDFEVEKFIPNTGYRFDFWLPYHNLIIEFHGEQHYKGWGGEEENLEKKEFNDKVKEDWAQERGHQLLIIPYWDFKNIPAILKGVFNV